MHRSVLAFDGVRFGDAGFVEFYKHVAANLLRGSCDNLGPGRNGK